MTAPSAHNDAPTSAQNAGDVSGLTLREAAISACTDALFSGLDHVDIALAVLAVVRDAMEYDGFDYEPLTAAFTHYDSKAEPAGAPSDADTTRQR